MKFSSAINFRFYTITLSIFGLLLFQACKEGDGKMSAINSPNVSTDVAQSAGLTLPAGFKAQVVAEDIGAPRHIAVTASGGIYVKLRQLVDDKGILYLEESDGEMKVKQRFGDYGGTGIFLDEKYLYATSDVAIYRYALDENQKVINPEKPEVIAKDLIKRGAHATKSITLDGKGNIYVNIGAYSNNCQEEDRAKGSLGMMPCPILDSAGGIWRFRIDQMNQTYGAGNRYATGLRNVVGLDWNKQADKLVVMQHGRDQLNNLYPELYDEKTSANLPAEAMYILEAGDDAGWPYIYYDQHKKAKIKSPEYGGDGIVEAGENVINPIATFPAHLAPNALLFYTGDMFPDKYKNGAFIAFHGSWNRTPEEQEGFNVVFQPFSNGQPSGASEVFADGFAGIEKIVKSNDALHRPTGLAQGPDGALYVSDDKGGSIYRISY